MSSIQALPLEILLEIFKYFTAEELLRNVLPVCSTWNKAIRHLSVWDDFVYRGHRTVEGTVKFIIDCPMVKHIYGSFSRVSPSESVRLVNAILENCSNVRTLCISFGSSSLTSSQVDALFEAFPNLEAFNITIEPENAVEVVNIISKCTSLKTLRMYFLYYQDGLLKQIADGCSSLEHLLIDAKRIQKFLGKLIPENDYAYIFENLKDRLLTLNINDVQPVTQKMVDTLGMFTKLEKLALENDSETVVEEINYDPLTNIKTLKDLEFVSCVVDMTSLMPLFDALFLIPFPQLERISFRFCADFLDTPILKYICRCYPNLKSLFLWYRLENNKDSFREIPRLKQLECLMYTENRVTDADVQSIARCKNLRKLSLRGCPGLTDKAVAHLTKCKSLEDLDLSVCQLSGKNLHLFPENLKNLKNLRFYSSAVENKYIQELASMMPSLNIVRRS